MYARPQGIENTRIWVDGCFDFTHHGHAGAMMQARQLGKELYVGVHSDEEILKNKGPVVMRLAERMTAVDGCKWSTRAIADAPYVTDPEFMKSYGCEYVVHGDDITTDADGNDCYQTVKDLGMFVVVKRTPNISTTDLVGRMLLRTKTHHLPRLTSLDHELFGADNVARYRSYATDATGLRPHAAVYVNLDQLHAVVDPSPETASGYAKIVYIDGAFDLFHPGHIEALKVVHGAAQRLGAKVIVGIHDDQTVNGHKDLNYPIMTVFERSLCVLQCKYVDGIVLGAPMRVTVDYLRKFPGEVVAVYHGPSPDDPENYAEVEAAGLLQQIGPHPFDNMNTKFIVNRVLSNIEAYEERQRKKGWKADNEKKLKDAENARFAS